MGKKSNDKGKRGEREVAALIRNHGFEARRGQQRRGGGDSPDVIHSIPRVHVEVKRTEALRLYDAMDQAGLEASAGENPVVFHRRSGRNWVAIMDARFFLNLAALVEE